MNETDEKAATKKAIEDARKDVLCEDIYFVTETGEKIDDIEDFDAKDFVESLF